MSTTPSLTDCTTLPMSTRLHATAWSSRARVQFEVVSDLRCRAPAGACPHSGRLSGDDQRLVTLAETGIADAINMAAPLGVGAEQNFRARLRRPSRRKWKAIGASHYALGSVHGDRDGPLVIASGVSQPSRPLRLGRGHVLFVVGGAHKSCPTLAAAPDGSISTACR